MGFFDRCRFGLLGFVFLALSAPTYAADYTVTAEAGSFYTRNVTPASQVRSQTTFAARAMVPASPVVYTTRPVVYSRATAAGLLRFAASPAGLVTVTGLQTFFSWWAQNYGGYFDEQTGAPISPGVSGECPGGTLWGLNHNNVAGRTLSGVLASEQQYHGAQGAKIIRLTIGADGRYAIRYRRLSDGAEFNEQGAGRTGGCPTVPIVWEEPEENPPPAAAAPMMPPEESTAGSERDPDQFFGDFEQSPYADDSDVIGDIFEDAQGRPWNTAEIEAMRQAIRDELASQDGTDPSTLPGPGSGTSADPSNPDAPESQPDGWSNESPSAGGGSQTTTEVPAFCEWAGIVCDWIGWTQDDAISPDPDPDMPFTDLPQPAEWDSGFGSGTCPPPIVVPVFSSQVEIPWQPACDLAVMLRPLLLAIAGLSAALILLGQRAGGSGS